MRGWMQRIGMMCVLVGLCGCGAFVDVAEFAALADGEPCGPCGLGTFDGDQGECRLGGLKGAVAPADACSAVVFLDPAEEAEGDGTQDAPFRRLDVAVQAAAQAGAKVVVIGGEPTLEGPLRMRDGVSVVGQYDRQWRADKTLRPTIETTGESQDAHVSGFVGEGLERKTVLAGLRIRTSGAGHQHYGGRLRAAGNVVLRDLDIRAADASAGEVGLSGEDGADGSDGQYGSARTRSEGGGSGRNPSCPVADGGEGGRGLLVDAGVRGAEDGQDAAAGAAGGRVVEGQEGQKGEEGAEGQDGQDAELAPEGRISQGVWQVGVAEPGEDGEDGSGGGGGAGGSGEANQMTDGDFGGGGGGGGAGGCGGEGGDPGESGGASIGLLVDGGTVTLDRTSIASGNGGDGAAGADGGAGGAGGDAGVGANSSGAAEKGGDGGAGGPGGEGGQGGPGRGGPSFGIACRDANVVEEQNVSISGGEPGEHGGEVEGTGRAARAQNCF